jgi:hypothetical protein
MTFRRVFTLAALAGALLVATGASSQAAYTLTSSAPTSNPSPPTIGGTAFTLTATGGGSQSGSTASNFNVIDVGVSSSTAPPASDSGTITVGQTYTITGSGGTESYALSATINLISGNSGGVVSTGSGSVSVTSGPTGGPGYLVSFANYGSPSPGSGGTGGTTGNFAITVIPQATVPEPASMVMLGSGVVGVLGLGLRRRLKKA